MEDIKTAMSFQADYVAVSFPKNATDMEMARQLCNVAAAEFGHKPGMIAKIERAEAIPKLEEILRASDGIMVARGDLAVEVGNAAVPALQKKMIRMAREMDKVVITATQMMESMITNPVPTRAEVSDVANAVLDGTDAVMLSRRNRGRRATRSKPCRRWPTSARPPRRRRPAARRRFQRQELHAHRPVDRHGRAVHRHHLGAKAIVALTESGSTPLWMSRHRVAHPDLCADARARDAAQDGAVPQRASAADGPESDRDTALGQAEAHLKKRGIVQTGDVYAITCGEPMGAPGRHQHAEDLPGELTKRRGPTQPVARRVRTRRMKFPVLVRAGRAGRRGRCSLRCSPLKVLNGLVPSDTYRLEAGIAYGAAPRQQLDVYRPLADTRPPKASRPLVVFFYGGTWSSGDRADYQFVGEALASRGAVVVDSGLPAVARR